jgi:hypothetical protein
MKKFSFLALLIVLFIACKKNQPGTTPVLKGKITGKWNFDSVVTVFRDSTGKNILGKNTYPNSNGTYFQFNTNNTWVENLIPDSLNDLSQGGEYQLLSDTSFILSGSGAHPYSETCKIYSLSPSVFVFSHRHDTRFNGVTPGSIEYIFTLSR